MDEKKTAYIHGKCINIVADIWHSPEQADWKAGALAVGHSETTMLAGVSAWLRWRQKRQAQGEPVAHPNFVITEDHSPVWERFANLWHIEMRQVPLTPEHPSLDVTAAVDMCDECTIGVVAVENAPLTGLNDDVAALDAALDRLASAGGPDIPIHVDAGAGGFTLPYLHPGLPWDFRTERVVSISTSDSSAGLMFPGAGWVCWRDKGEIPEGMSFSVSYLGVEINQVGLNFSRPTYQFFDQYCRFVRTGRENYRRLQLKRMESVRAMHDAIKTMGPFDTFTTEPNSPVFSWFIRPGHDGGWTLADLQDRLARRGWTIPVNRMPGSFGELHVMPFVAVEGMDAERGHRFMADLREAVAELEGA